MKPYILLDAGGTLLFPKFDWISSLLSSKGINVDTIEIFKKFSRTNYEIDRALKNGGTNPWNGGLSEFVRQMLSAIDGIERVIDEIVSAIVREDKKKSLWSYTFNWTKSTLEELKSEGYFMSVVSNSDGRVESMIIEVGLRGYFDKVYDSYIVGSSKPDSKIYELALDELCLKPREALFVGDMFYIDVLGANKTNIPAVHLDPFGYYSNWPGVRIKNLKELLSLLKNSSIAIEEFFPFSNDIQCKEEIL